MIDPTKNSVNSILSYFGVELHNNESFLSLVVTLGNLGMVQFSKNPKVFFQVVKFWHFNRLNSSQTYCWINTPGEQAVVLIDPLKLFLGIKSNRYWYLRHLLRSTQVGWRITIMPVLRKLRSKFVSNRHIFWHLIRRCVDFSFS